MKTPRFNDGARPSAISRVRTQKHARLKWVPVSHFGDALLDLVGSGRKRIFAIMAPPLPAERGGKPLRRILIFDNHPASLRLISRQHPNQDLASLKLRPLRRDLIVGLFLILVLVAAMFWPLFLL
jgi:hypothetical protein